MKACALALLALLCACSAADPGVRTTTGPQTTRVYVEGGGSETVHEFNRIADDQAVNVGIPASRAAAYEALAALLGEWQIPVTAADPTAYTLGSQTTARRRLGGQPLSTYLNCGVGGATRAPLANSYEVLLDLSTALRENAQGGTELQVLLRGRARDPIHNNPPVPCTSTGRLERRIADELAVRTPGT